MKIIHICSTILLALAFVSGEETSTGNLRNLSEEERELLSLQKILGSAKCKIYTSRFFKQMRDMVMKNSANSVAQYVCNPLERKKIKETERRMVKDQQKPAAKKNPCVDAGEKLILKKKSALKKAEQSTASCKAEIKKETAALKQVVEEAERRMLADGAHRELPALITAGVITAGIGAAAAVATAVGGVATAGINVANTAVGRKKRVRKLSKIESALDYETVEDTFDLCKDEKYNLFMYVESDGSHQYGHINIVAKPSDDNSEDCKDALTFDDYDAGERLISFVDDVSFADSWHTDALPLGSFALRDVKTAADSATVVKPNEYDIMTNNCATFIIEVLGHLKIPISTEVKHYTVNSLVGSPGLVQAIGGSESSEAAAENKELMWNFVSKYIEDHKLL